MTLTLADLVLCGTDEAFYLTEGETLESIRDNGDGTAVVYVRYGEYGGGRDIIDADVRGSR